jgi:hypothetical protein
VTWVVVGLGSRCLCCGPIEHQLISCETVNIRSSGGRLQVPARGERLPQNVSGGRHGSESAFTPRGPPTTEV